MFVPAGRSPQGFLRAALPAVPPGVEAGRGSGREILGDLRHNTAGRSHPPEFKTAALDLKIKPGRNDLTIRYRQRPFVAEFRYGYTAAWPARGFTGFDYLLYPAGRGSGQEFPLYGHRRNPFLPRALPFFSRNGTNPCTKAISIFAQSMRVRRIGGSCAGNSTACRPTS